MRVMDFYLHHEGLIRENWVPLDMLDLLRQMGVDPLARALGGGAGAVTPLGAGRVTGRAAHRLAPVPVPSGPWAKPRGRDGAAGQVAR